MQPVTGASEDIHAILGRFNTWTATQSTNGDGRSLQVGSDELRELAYEEAIRRYGSWPPVLTTMAKTAAPAPQTNPQPVPSPTIPEISQSTVEVAAPPSVSAPLDGSEALSAVQEKASIRKAATARKAPSKATVNAPGKSAKQSHALTGTQEKTRTAKKAVSSLDIAAGSGNSVPGAIEKEHVAGADHPASMSKKNVAPSAEVGHPDSPKTDLTRRTAFRDVLAHTIEAPNPERNTRISIRFSAQEESLVRKTAAEAGLTVSAFLRERALQAYAAPTVAAGAASRTKLQPIPGLGARLVAWIGGLRQRSA